MSNNVTIHRYKPWTDIGMMVLLFCLARSACVLTDHHVERPASYTSDGGVP